MGDEADYYNEALLYDGDDEDPYLPRRKSMKPKTYIKIKVDLVKKETEKAYLVVIEEDEHWIPKSQCKGEYWEGDVDKVMEITEWIAGEKELEASE